MDLWGIWVLYELNVYTLIVGTVTMLFYIYFTSFLHPLADCVRCLLGLTSPPFSSVTSQLSLTVPPTRQMPPTRQPPVPVPVPAGFLHPLLPVLVFGL